MTMTMNLNWKNGLTLFVVIFGAVLLANAVIVYFAADRASTAYQDQLKANPLLAFISRLGTKNP